LLDKEQERFDVKAIESMVKSVNDGSIPIKAEHEHKFYSELGVWKEAKLINDRMYVKGEIDLDLSL
jgi:hypothetical protein